ncbi:MFS transporter [Paractinoplanes brasiliensis]|uniref:Putative MFS family arabinose efflux permease n=1 Tax=Paractinoplanes brasiliensis TaxID=52695 RepID=A0A4R6J6V0_9ACTN|nr:MFS transporter [Actinoplanes brasiliensis]TDO31233.1 putative MFS family arabinose efflux permease [Actinoplanes brasiliensis]GID28450.1 MFS transporter [Actinoplanes brasiliensis]
MSTAPAERIGATAVLRHPYVPLVLTGSQIGRLPLAASPLALLLFARETVSLALAGALVAVFTAGMAIGAPVLARAVDRWRQPPVLYGSAALSTVGYLIAASGSGRPLVIGAGAALAGLGTPPLEACLRALWPALVPPGTVHAAYALDIAVQEVIFVGGPLVTLGAVAVGGTSAGLYAAAATQVIGVVAFVRAPAVREWLGTRTQRHWAGPLRSGRLAVVVGGVTFVGAAVGSIPVVLTGYAEAAGDRSLTGWLLAAQAAGALAGGLIYTRAKPGGPRRLPVLTAVFAVGYLPLLIAPGTTAMTVLLILSGLMLPPVLTAVFLAADRLAPSGTAVEAFAWIMTAFSVGSALGAAAAGPLTDVGVRAGFALAPVVAVMAVLAMAAATASDH